MTKIRAAGDEPDSWVARSEEEIRDAGLWDAVDFAAKEIDNTDNAMVFENGLEWTRAWYELDLEKFTEPGAVQPIDAQTAANLSLLADQNGRVNDLLKEVIASQIQQGFELPLNLRQRLIEMLRGTVPSPQAKVTAREPKYWSRDYMINHVAGLVSTLYDVDHKRGKETDSTIAASDIIYHALRRRPGKPLGFGTIQNIIFNPDTRLKPLNERNQKNFADIKSQILISIFDDYDD